VARHEAHPYAELFPMMTAPELEALAADVAENGQQVPILVDQHGRVIDGRNRLAACERAGVEPLLERRDFVDDAAVLAFIMSANLHRRQLSGTQRALIAARIANIRVGDNRGAHRPVEGEANRHTLNQSTISLEEAAEKLDVSRRSAVRARKIQRRAIPEIQQMVERGELKVLPAAEVAAMPQEEQREMAELGAEGITRVQGEKRKKTRARGKKPEREAAPQNGQPEVRGVGVFRANEAINCLTRIPKNDALRERGFQIVKDWIRRNA
jgi:ParB-like chromosome segregation protein Spo0J